MKPKKQFHKSGKQIIAQKKYQSFLKKINGSEEFDLPDLTGKEVVLNTNEYDRRISNGELSEKFKTWYGENRDKKFTVKGKANGFNLMYVLEDVDIWFFNFYDLLNPETGTIFFNEVKNEEL